MLNIYKDVRNDNPNADDTILALKIKTRIAVKIARFRKRKGERYAQ